MRKPWYVLASALLFVAVPSPTAFGQQLLWENKGQAEFGGFFLDAAAQGRVIVTNGAVFDDQFNYRWFVRGQDWVTGATLWEDQLDPDSFFDGANEIAVDDGRAFAAGFVLREDTGYLFVVRAYALKTGHLLWDRRVNRGFGRDTAKVVAARDGRVFVGGYLDEEVGGFNFALLAFDARTGALLWEQVMDSGMDRGDTAWSVSVSGERVFVSGDIRDGTSSLIRAHAAGTGSLLWEKEVAGASNLVAEEDVMTADGGSVFSAARFADGDFLVQSYDARTGKRQWSDRVEVGNRFSQSIELAVAGGRLFAAGVIDCDPVTFVECKLLLRAYDARTGALLWQDIQQSSGNDWYVNGVAAGAGRVFVGGARLNQAGDYECAILGYESRTGTLAWEESFDGGGAAFEGVYDLMLERGRLFALGQLSSGAKHSDVFVRAYRLAAHGDDVEEDERWP